MRSFYEIIDRFETELAASCRKSDAEYISNFKHTP